MTIARKHRTSQFVRGGQTTQHWTRMALQVMRYAVIATVTVFTLTYTLLVLMNYELSGMKLTYAHWMAEFQVENRGNEDRIIRYQESDGQYVIRRASDIYLDPRLRRVRSQYQNNARRFIWLSLVPAAFAFGCVIFVFANVGRGLKNEEYLRGAKLVSVKEMKRWTRRKWHDYEKHHGKDVKTAPRYTIAGIPFPPNAAEAQIGLYGTVGTGKTNAMHELLATIRKQAGRVIIYDRMGFLTAAHYSPETDLILNPFDARSVGWSPFNEARSVADFAQMAEAMIPDRPGNADPFWTMSARIVFQYAGHKLALQGESSNAALRHAIMTMPAGQLGELLEQTPGQHFFGKNIERTSANIRANLISELQFLEYLRDDATPFSIRKWVIEDTRPGFVFLTGHAEQAAATRNITSAVIETAVNALMTMPVSRDPRLWFFLDEVHSLNKLPFLPRSLAETRQFGGVFALGFQVFSQIEDIYGTKAAQSVMGVLNNRIVFNTPDYDTALRASRSLGEEDVIEQQENLTLGAHETRDGVGIIARRTQRPIVTPAEIQSLPQFKAYFRPAYDAPTALIRFETQYPKGAEASFIPYYGNGFDIGGMQLCATQTLISEGEQPVDGFMALHPDRQKAQFMRWYEHIRPGEDARILDHPENRSERDWYWQHYATHRIRGMEGRAILPPSPTAGRIGHKQQPWERHVDIIGFPGEAAGGACGPDVEQKTQGELPLEPQNTPAPDRQKRAGKEQFLQTPQKRQKINPINILKRDMHRFETDYGQAPVPEDRDV